MSERVETFKAKHTVASFDDGGDELSLFITAGTGTDVEITGTIAELTKFATDLIGELILKGDVG